MFRLLPAAAPLLVQSAHDCSLRSRSGFCQERTEAKQHASSSQGLDDRRSGRSRGWSLGFGSGPSNQAPGQYNALRLGIASMEGNLHSEDRFAYDEVFISGHPVPILSVFDGHGGWQVAHFLEHEMASAIRRHIPESERSSTAKSHIPKVDANVLEDVLHRAYVDVDSQLAEKLLPCLKIGFDRFVRIGSCAITVAVTDTHYVVANTGDCRAVLISKDGATKLSNVHNANEESERDRLRTEHPGEPDVVQCVQAFEDVTTKELYLRPYTNRVAKEVNCYIKGLLQPTRAFGDFALKRDDMNIDHRSQGALVPQASSMPYITAQPEMVVMPRTSDDELLVIGSDGLFDFLSDREIAEIARSANSPNAAGKALVEAVKAKALKSSQISEQTYNQLPIDKRRDVHDDTTALVFYLQYPEAWKGQWIGLSEHLQHLVDQSLAELDDDTSMADFNFSVCIADPMLQDCPLVAVSKGFEELTGYSMMDAIGRNCRFLSYGIPADKEDEETSSRLRNYTRVAMTGDPFSIAGMNTSVPSWAPKGAFGGSYFLRWNRKKDGELFQNLFLLRQLWVGERTYLLALQTRLPADTTEKTISEDKLCKIELLCDEVSSAILGSMTTIENRLTPAEVPEMKAPGRKSKNKKKR